MHGQQTRPATVFGMSGMCAVTTTSPERGIRELPQRTLKSAQIILMHGRLGINEMTHRMGKR